MSCLLAVPPCPPYVVCLLPIVLQPAACGTCPACWTPPLTSCLTGGGAQPTPWCTTTSWYVVLLRVVCVLLGVYFRCDAAGRWGEACSCCCTAVCLPCRIMQHLACLPHPHFSHTLQTPLQATGGMRSFLKQFEACLELLRQLPPEPAASAAAAAAGGATLAPQQAQQAGQQQQDTEMADTAGPAAALEGGTAGGTDATGGTATQPISPAKAYRQSVEAAVGTFLVLMTNMR